MSPVPARPRRRRVRPERPRWAFAPPRQERARESVDRFAEAAETLLRDKPFEAIGVQELARLAGRTTGAFYARFRSKDGLLPYLYERYDRGLESVMRRRMAGIAWAELDLEGAARALVGVILGYYVERRWFMRAMALFARRFPEALPRDIHERRQRFHDLAVDVLRPHARRIRHPDPDAAVRFGVFAVSAAAREKLLFADAPHARVTAITPNALQEQLSRMLIGYLVAPAPGAAGRGRVRNEGGAGR